MLDEDWGRDYGTVGLGADPRVSGRANGHTTLAMN